MGSPTPQLPLALRYPPEQRFETFLSPPPGALAQLRALAVETDPRACYLYGPAGSGKTHLALAVCAAAEQAGRRVAYLPLQAAAGRVADALQAVAGNEVVVLDGLQHVVGGRDDEVALFDLHNRAHDTGIGLLYTADAAPDALPLVLPDLRSRLSQCARIRLQPLDDEGRRALLRGRAQRRGLVLEDAAVEWLLVRTARDPGSLLGLLDRLDRASLAAQRRVTVPFLKQVLGVADAG
ncbi:DnaA regulatory inactivator Hda [Pseudoxanthomonas kalamensis DSM 18571]|uniref:DnaA regulatory inactivator Hda n=1 Tax=Pseudoxanthomonas kalamensis TaxID=289483 RepID=UPI001391A803|nr:DnaA regulatory inactivator Hda [Pseudoxanthomonas kalamensis]KAF1711415.1 DnaA regulatory inactivator Hda [Pseudoxanthomonas kalamensis DSM 18571]